MNVPKTPQEKMDDLVEKILDKAAQDCTSLPEKVDALKAVTAYHLARQKRRPKSPPDDEPEEESGGFTFGGGRADGGNPTVPTRRDS